MEPAGIVGHLDIASTCIGSRVPWAAGVRGLNLIVTVSKVKENGRSPSESRHTRASDA